MNVTGVEPKRIQTRISPRHICCLFTPSPGHIAHAQSAVMALLADLLPGLAAHARSATITISFTFYRGKTYVHCPSAMT